MSSTIGWFPNGQGSGALADWLRHIILPAILLGLGGLITFTRFVRSEVLEVLGTGLRPHRPREGARRARSCSGPTSSAPP